MKALLSASSSLSRRLLNPSSARKNCVTTAAVRRSSGVCAAHHEKIMSKPIAIDVSHPKILETNSHLFHVSHPLRRLMGTAAQDRYEDDDDDSDSDAEVEVQAANERCWGKLQIKKVNPYQWGVFAQRPYVQGSIVIFSNLTDVNQANPKATSCSHSIQTNWNEHILMDLPAQFLNHSCDPNIGVVKELNEGGSYDFVALRDIEEGEEVRFDYETTEYEVGAFADCKCGADICRRNIKGYKYNKDVILEQYGGKNVAGYLTEE